MIVANKAVKRLESEYSILEFDRIRERLAACAASPLGAELATQVSLISDFSHLRESMQQTTEMRDLVDYDQSVPMEGIHDLRRYYHKIRIAGSHLFPEEFIAISQTLAVVRRLKVYFHARKAKAPNLTTLAESLHPQESLEKDIHRCIDESSLAVKDDASSELASLRKQIIRTQNQARSKMESLVRNLSSQGILQENIITVRDSRLVLMVKEEYKRKVHGLVHDQSASGSSLFIEPLETLEDNNRIRELQAQEQHEIERILTILTDKIRASFLELEFDVDILARLDMIYAKAVFSRLLAAHPPELIEEAELHIAGGRHPLLLLRMGEKQVVPLDLDFSDTFRTLIISGPNAGGKTVALKTIGLITLMARCGLHIPALPHSKIGAINLIFASIGDQQSIDNDLSTFSSHLESLKYIAEHADRRSLVLIDEIGAGTDPEEGSALAMALLERLTQIGSLTVVTTHQSALKAFAYRTDGVANGSMEFDVKTLKPTYRFRAGIPGSSYAFEIASRMGLIDGLIDRARELVGSQKDRLEGLILELEGKIQHYQEMVREVSIKESEYRGLAKLYKERNDIIRREEKQIKRKAVAEAEEMLSGANAAVEKAIRDIKEQNAKREVIRDAKQSLEQQRRKVEREKKIVAEEKDERVQSEPITTGDIVRWVTFNSVGQVISGLDAQGRVMLQMGGVKIKAPLAELHKVIEQSVFQQAPVRVVTETPTEYKNEIDLRGLRAEEALEKVEIFLDEAILAGFSAVRIIHGKGTGRLRTSITHYLRQHPRVQASRLGNWNEGEAGVTVVELKNA